MKEVQITALVNDRVRARGLLAEHGLSLWIRLPDCCVLFDTGQTGLVRSNAERLQIDVESADALVLSHGHYDHTGGVDAVLPGACSTTVFVHPSAFGSKFSCNADAASRYLGMPDSTRRALEQRADCVATSAPVEVGGGLSLTGTVPRVTDYEDAGGPFFKDRDCKQPDMLMDDQAGFIDTPAGVVVIVGCAHAGLINTLWYIRELMPGRSIHAVIGGTHLAGADERRMQNTVEALREFDVRYLIPMHCTGFAAAARLWSELPGRVSTLPAGGTLEFPR